MKKRNIKAFTLVELLVVIAILAVLATAAIIGYSSFIEKANVSNDNTVVTELNRFTDAYIAGEGKVNTVTDIANELKKDGFLVSTLKPSASKDLYAFNIDTKKFLVIDTEKLDELPASLQDRADIFVLVGSEEAYNFATSNKLSMYLQTSYTFDGIFEAQPIEAGLDVGEVTGISAINYDRHEATSKLEVVIRTNSLSTTLTINDTSTNSSIKHYGDLGTLTVIQVPYDCYYEHGHTIYAKATQGKVVAKEGGNIDVLYATEASVAAVEDGGIISAAYCVSTSEAEELPSGYTNFSNGKNGNVTFQYIDEKGNLLTDEKIEGIAIIETGKALGNPTGRIVQIGENPFAGLYTDVFFMQLEDTLELNFAEDIYEKWPDPSYRETLIDLIDMPQGETKNIEVIEQSSNIEVIVDSELVKDIWGDEDEYLDFTISITSLSGGLGSIKLCITNIFDESAEIEFKVMVTDNRVSIGDTIYEDLSQAVAAANDGDIIKLMNDIGDDYMSVVTGEWQLAHTYANNELWDDVQKLYIRNVYNMNNRKSLILDLNGKTILTNSLTITDTNLTIIDSVGGGMITGDIQCNCSGNTMVDHYVTSGSNLGRVTDYSNPNIICLAGGSYPVVNISNYVEVIIDGASIINTGELGYYNNAVSGNATAATLIVKSGIFGTEASNKDINLAGIGTRFILMGGIYQHLPDCESLAGGYHIYYNDENYVVAKTAPAGYSIVE